MTKNIASTRIVPCSSGRSRWKIATDSRNPVPGHAAEQDEEDGERREQRRRDQRVCTAMGVLGKGQALRELKEVSAYQ